MNNGKIEYSYELYIAAPPEKVWKGLIDADSTKQYVYGTRLQSTLKKGAPYAYLGDGDFKVVDGRILEIEPGKRHEEPVRGRRLSRIASTRSRAARS